ncbi:MAG TPA: CHASE3 domain-containing protein, partial [Polyangiaceae bacterium]
MQTTQFWTFGKKIAFGFGLSITILLVVGFVSYRAADVLIDNDHRVNHSYAVLEDSGRLLSYLKDAETGQRGFVLTG